MNSIRSSNYDQAEFLVAGQQTTKQGKLTIASLVIAFEEGHRPTAEATWKAWEPPLLKSGWKIVGQNEFLVHTLSRKEGTVESFLEF